MNVTDKDGDWLTPELQLFDIGAGILSRMSPDDRLSLFIAAVCEANPDGAADAELRWVVARLTKLDDPEERRIFDEILRHYKKYAPYTNFPPKPRIKPLLKIIGPVP
jgi:hypothetical protein